MKFIQILVISTGIMFFASCSPAARKSSSADMSEQLKKSLVNLRISIGGYEEYQPWKQKDVAQKNAYGCAVGPYLILTTASNIANATIVQARRYDKNEFIPATIKAVDYQYNLCILELDKEAAGQPLEPVVFVDQYNKKSELSIYWLSTASHVTSARGVLDRAQYESNPVSYNTNLNYILTNPSRGIAGAEVVFDNQKAVGIVAWSGGSEVGVIPSESINRFLKEAQTPVYKGFGAVGFEAATLLDPAVRKHLKMPTDIQHGIYINKVYSFGTASTELKAGDAVLSIDGKTLNPYGRYLHEKYDRLAFNHLIESRFPGEKIPFEIFRDGKRLTLDVEIKNFAVSDMLVPCYDYDKQPKYLVYGGYVFQKLTREYYTLFGDDWTGKVTPHLYQYYLYNAFNPTDDRTEIVFLSFVLPAPINLGYQDLARIVVSTWNGKKIRNFNDILEAKKLNPQSPFDVVEFELDFPKVIIPRQMAQVLDPQIAKIYGIQKLENIK
jgi:S1-C subfamily serine protease